MESAFWKGGKREICKIVAFPCFSYIAVIFHFQPQFHVPPCFQQTMCAIPTATRRRRSLKHWLNPRSWRLVLLVFLAFVLLPLPTSVVESQYSAHCHFNQLCSCRVVPVKRPQNGLRSTSQPGNNRGRGPPTTTTGPTYTYTGQFGIIIPE